MCVIARRTVSIVPASTSERRVSRSRRPPICVESKIRLLSFGPLPAALLLQLGFGPFDSLELLLRRLGDEVVTAVEGEVGDHDSVDDRRPYQHPWVDEETGYQDEQGASTDAAQREQKADDSRHDQCYPRHVAAAGYREPPRKVPRPGERVDLARVGVDE